MSYRKIWIFALFALLISGSLMSANLFLGSLEFPHNAAARLMSSGWTISDGDKVLAENADFLKAGSLKNQSRVVLLKKLPDTSEESLCFVTIGCAAEAFVEDKSIYTFGSSLDGNFSGNLPEKLHIQGNDLCSLLVNMLDNAIGACSKVPSGKEKKIELVLRIKHDFVYFSVANSSAGVPVMAGEEFMTTKKDKERHGYGISIIRRIVRKYDGAFDIIPSQDSFLVRAALRNAPVP